MKQIEGRSASTLHRNAACCHVNHCCVRNILATVAQSLPTLPQHSEHSRNISTTYQCYLGWTHATPTPRLPSPRTIIVKLTDNTNWASVSPTTIGQAVQQAARLTKQESRDTFIKLRSRQNLLAANHSPANTYEANSPNNAQGVIRGVSLDLTDEAIHSELYIPSLRILRFRRLGQTASLLVTIERPTLPRHAILCSTVFRLYLPRPNSQQCKHCFSLEHRSLACPNRAEFVCCAACGSRFPPDQNPSDIRHECEPRCLNCNGEHAATDPSCPARLEATQSLQKRTRTGHRRNVHARGPPPLDTGVGNWPTLPPSSRFGILDSSRSRSRSKGPAQVQSARGSRTLKCSRSRRPNTGAPPPPSPVHNLQSFGRSRSSPRQNSTLHDLPRPLNNGIGQGFPPAREKRTIIPTSVQLPQSKTAILHTMNNSSMTLNLPRSQQPLIIWQWNCRGLRKKKNLLLNHMTFTHTQPEILVIQEAGGALNLRGYDMFAQPSITHRRRGTADESTTPTMTFNQVRDHRLTIINTYWTPNQPSTLFPPLQTLLPKSNARNTVLLLGDFNCPHPAWGYDHAVPLGRKLASFTSNHHFTLLTEPSSPTRLGTAQESDTTPDLTWIRGPLRAIWENTEDSLGSDHHILELRLQISSRLRRTTATYPRTKITDWPKVRADLDTVDSDTLSPEAWSTAILATIQQHTKEIARTEDQPHVDSHLLSLWEKRRALVERWRHCKHNTTLQARIQALNYECEEYADHLAIQHWLDLCNNFNGQLHTPRVWNLFRSLLGQAKPRNILQKLLLAQHLEPSTLIEEIRNTFYPPSSHPQPSVHYISALPEDLDTGINSEFSIGELWLAMLQLKRRTAPGPDCITYTMLRNLPEAKLDELLTNCKGTRSTFAFLVVRGTRNLFIFVVA
ncbi:hypothetical protein HPB47_007904 [Ixodes persulcatus]|uniref:Uncharacterized protein n=1 Tax=Ixodes persulcatus TaxID=34615 RepID=A0AC60P664_IXOPE|nr:hypothetical protein HPB47_007904 [Ixodes persulcatus]